MSDSEIITQLAATLPEGTEVPGWYLVNRAWRDSAGHGLSHQDELGLRGALAAFTYAAEGVLLSRGCAMYNVRGGCVVSHYSLHVVGEAPSRPAAALAALRKITGAADA